MGCENGTNFPTGATLFVGKSSHSVAQKQLDVFLESVGAYNGTIPGHFDFFADERSEFYCARLECFNHFRDNSWFIECSLKTSSVRDESNAYHALWTRIFFDRWLLFLEHVVIPALRILLLRCRCFKVNSEEFTENICAVMGDCKVIDKESFIPVNLNPYIIAYTYITNSNVTSALWGIASYWRCAFLTRKTCRNGFQTISWNVHINCLTVTLFTFIGPCCVMNICLAIKSKWACKEDNIICQSSMIHPLWDWDTSSISTKRTICINDTC